MDSELRVYLGTAEHSGWVGALLWVSLSIDPNPNGILLLQWFGPSDRYSIQMVKLYPRILFMIFNGPPG